MIPFIIEERNFEIFGISTSTGKNHIIAIFKSTLIFSESRIIRTFFIELNEFFYNFPSLSVTAITPRLLTAGANASFSAYHYRPVTRSNEHKDEHCAAVRIYRHVETRVRLIQRIASI